MKRTILFIFILVIYTSALHAQSDYIIRNDTALIGLKLIQPAGIKKYHSVIHEIKKEEFVTYTPDEISEFGISDQVFVSMSSPITGEDRNVFLHRLIKNDSIVVYLYEDGNGKHLYFGKTGQELIEINDLSNPYADYIRNKYQPDKNHPVNLYQIKPTPRSIQFANQLIRTRNPNLLTRIRYGVWMGGGFSMLSKDVMPEDNNDSHLFAGIFLNTPLYRQLSLHTELFYMQEAYSMSKETDHNITDQTFNRKAIVLPVMLRFSFIKTKGRIIPYLQAGPSAHYVLKKEIDERSIMITHENVSVTQKQGVEDKNYLFIGVNAGAGLEYRLNNRHSLFWDIRYMHGFDDETNNLFYMTLSFNL